MPLLLLRQRVESRAIPQISGVPRHGLLCCFFSAPASRLPWPLARIQPCRKAEAPPLRRPARYRLPSMDGTSFSEAASSPKAPIPWGADGASALIPPHRCSLSPRLPRPLWLPARASGSVERFVASPRTASSSASRKFILCWTEGAVRSRRGGVAVRRRGVQNPIGAGHQVVTDDHAFCRQTGGDRGDAYLQYLLA